MLTRKLKRRVFLLEWLNICAVAYYFNYLFFVTRDHYGFTTAQNQEHFVCHETRESVTDPVNGWWNSHSGAEADDECAWSPTPFIGTNGYAYQYEWSNANNACIKTR